MKYTEIPNLSSRSISRSRTRAKHKLDAPYKLTGYLYVGEFRTGGPLLKDSKTNKYFGEESAVNTFLEQESGKSSTVNVSFDAAPKTGFEINLTKINDLKYDQSLFVPIKTGKFIDGAFSQDGGIYPGTNYMLIGDPGIGKTTICLDILLHAMLNQKKKVLFISAEMNKIDMYGYAQRIKGFGDIPTLFLSDYTDHDTREVIAKTLMQGWDLVLIDSAAEVCEDLRAHGLSAKEADTWIIDQMTTHNEAKNDTKTYSSFIIIQQVTKGGNFVGSNKWKHNTTGMIELRFQDDDRYAIVTKNRRGFQFDKICFNIHANDVVYREDLYKVALEADAMSKKEEEQKIKDQEKFNEMFLSGKEEQQKGINKALKELENIPTSTRQASAITTR